MESEARLKNILEGGYCIGCGACGAVSSSVSVAMNKDGMFRADFSKVDACSKNQILEVCPFSDKAENESQISSKEFKNCTKKDEYLGHYMGLYAGHVSEGDYRKRGTSGGVITWICSELLRKNLADYIIQVRSEEGGGSQSLFSYQISSSVAEVKAASKSRYYPVEMSGVLKALKKRPGRYVVVGLPCFIKAVRNLQRLDPVVKERVAFTIGLVCGHLKSKAFADSFGWQSGIRPGDLDSIDFRVKMPDRRAGDYGVSVSGKGVSDARRTREFFGYNWGYNFFRYPACNFCDDVFAETADIVVGDAWINDYEKDPRGNSVVVVRKQELKMIIDGAISDDRLSLNTETPEVIIKSQEGGLRDRREGLSYRLYLKDRAGLWRPRKRVQASKKGVPLGRRQVYRMRLKMEKASHEKWREAVERGDFEYFRKAMSPLLIANGLIWNNFSKKVLGKCKGALGKLKKLAK